MVGFKTQTLQIDGMQGDACVRRVTQELGAVPGVRVDAVHVGAAHVLAEPECGPLMRNAIEKAGYRLKTMDVEG